MFKKLKWLSLENIWESLQALFRRFPLVAVDTLVATVLGIVLLESERQIWSLSDSLENILSKVLLLAVLGFPLLTGLTLLSEKLKWKTLFHWLAQGVGIIFLALYYLVLPQDLDNMTFVHGTRLVIFNIVAYLLALSLPFYEKNHSLRFWRFVETAFARLVVSAFFSVTLWAGIALSLAAIDYLFDVKIDGEFYMEAWAVIVGIFGAWFFLSGFPKVHESLPEGVEKSKVLHIFAEYICVPLLCIFFVILYVYLGRIVFLWDWPKGGVANWILGFSSAGFLVYILAYPLVQKNEHEFLRKFFRVFFALVLPMVVVLFMAIGIRLKEYGVTESRYLVALGGVWLLASSVYFLFSKQKELKVLPYLVTGFLLFSIFGPWGMYAVSVQSQYTRLEKLLVQYNLLENNKAKPAIDENMIPIADRASIYSKIQFIASREQEGKLHEWFPEVASTTTPSNGMYYNFVDEAMRSLKITKYYDYQRYEDSNYMYLNSFSPSGITDISGFDTLLNTVYLYEYDESIQSEEVKPATYQVVSTTYSFVLDKNTLKVLENDREIINHDLRVYLTDWIEKFSSSRGVTSDGSMDVTVQNSNKRFKFILNNLSLERKTENDDWNIRSGDMNVLIDNMR